MTILQEKILNVMKSQNSYKNWGRTAMGYIEISTKYKLGTQKTIADAMKRMFINGVFHNHRVEEETLDTKYYLKNTKKELDYH